jgi:hypothetical protein
LSYLDYSRYDIVKLKVLKPLIPIFHREPGRMPNFR